ncbi:MAG: 50S ribosomal protein L9 [Bordetella sp.]|nr:MAG: 50S ribosomal protein L9 [Bordetella sp.]
MKIILLEKVFNLGNFGEIVRVRNGYARNFLIPKKIAKRATESSIREFEIRRLDLKEDQEKKLVLAKLMAKNLSEFKITIIRKSRVGGNLYGSVTNRDIAESLKKEGIKNLEKSQICLSDGHIKKLGEYSVKIFLGSGISQNITVYVKSEES